MWRARCALLVIMLGIPAGGPARADEACRRLDPDRAITEVCRVETWLHPVDAPVGNLGFLGRHTYPTWSTTPPATATSDGGGAISLSEDTVGFSQGGEPLNGAIFEGTFTGNIDTLGFRMHVWEPHRATCPPFSCFATAPFELVVRVDGAVLYESGQRYEQMPVKDRESERHRLDFAVTGLFERMMSSELLVGRNVRHDVRVELVTASPTAYEYGATDVPSGVLFNVRPDELGDYPLLLTG
ncbi:MAG: hypothetical protein M3245_02325 [Actinomycetota bacterium]|nr:hypothetical protein [Actinomycetota bacterium]